MASQTVLSQQVDGLSTIRDLISLKPGDIVALHEEARAQLALTDAEQAKYDEAKAFMANYDKASADMKKAQDDLAASIALHESNVAMQEADYAQRIASVEAREADVSKREADVVSLAKELDARDADFDKSRQDVLDQFSQRQAQLDAQESANIAAASANSDEAARLLGVKADLQAKAQKLQELASS